MQGVGSVMLVGWGEKSFSFFHKNQTHLQVKKEYTIFILVKRSSKDFAFENLK